MTTIRAEGMYVWNRWYPNLRRKVKTICIHVKFPVEYSMVQSVVWLFAMSNWGSSISSLTTRGSVIFHMNTRSCVVCETAKQNTPWSNFDVAAYTFVLFLSRRRILTAFDHHWANLGIVWVWFEFHCTWQYKRQSEMRKISFRWNIFVAKILKRLWFSSMVYLTSTCTGAFCRDIARDSDSVLTSRGMWPFLHSWRSNLVSIYCATNRHREFYIPLTYFPVTLIENRASFAPEIYPQRTSANQNNRHSVKTFYTPQMYSSKLKPLLLLLFIFFNYFYFFI